MKKSHRAIDIFAQNIRFARRQKSLSLEEVASRTSSHQATLSRIETGKGNPTLETCGQLADVLDVDLQDLLDPNYIGKALQSPHS
ncbi:MAG: helix-turn-helix transcriptional regulator [Gammaproteobacteria bacterium]|nr:helix-turn-helix transcriptional regulator [Gammaproteobacteria bacterium]